MSMKIWQGFWCGSLGPACWEEIHAQKRKPTCVNHCIFLGTVEQKRQTHLFLRAHPLSQKKQIFFPGNRRSLKAFATRSAPSSRRVRDFAVGVAVLGHCTYLYMLEMEAEEFWTFLNLVHPFTPVLEASQNISGISLFLNGNEWMLSESNPWLQDISEHQVVHATKDQSLTNPH